MSDVELVNRALARLGKKSINDLEDPQEEARQAKRFLDTTKRELQADYPWSFTRAVADLSPLADHARMAEGLHAYTLPSDYLRADRITPVPTPPLPAGDALAGAPRGADRFIYERTTAGYSRTAPPLPEAARYQIAGDVLLAAFAPLRLHYHKYVEEPSRMTTQFRAALTAVLAFRLCMPLTRDRRMMQALDAEAQRATTMARDLEAALEADFYPVGNSLRGW